jgi:hypothetical protein
VTTSLQALRIEAPSDTRDLDHERAETRPGLPSESLVMPIDGDRATHRRRRAERLATAASGDRHQLEELRAGYLCRLLHTSDDFEATEGLRTVEAALSMTPRSQGLWAWQRQVRAPRRRWWHRLRRL